MSLLGSLFRMVEAWAAILAAVGVAVLLVIALPGLLRERRPDLRLEFVRGFSSVRHTTPQEGVFWGFMLRVRNDGGGQARRWKVELLCKGSQVLLQSRSGEPELRYYHPGGGTLWLAKDATDVIRARGSREVACIADFPDDEDDLRASYTLSSRYMRPCMGKLALHRRDGELSVEIT
jgi:hypothetical protein